MPVTGIWGAALAAFRAGLSTCAASDGPAERAAALIAIPSDMVETKAVFITFILSLLKLMPLYDDCPSGGKFSKISYTDRLYVRRILELRNPLTQNSAAGNP